MTEFVFVTAEDWNALLRRLELLEDTKYINVRMEPTDGAQWGASYGLAVEINSASEKAAGTVIIPAGCTGFRVNTFWAIALADGTSSIDTEIHGVEEGDSSQYEYFNSAETWTQASTGNEQMLSVWPSTGWYTPQNLANDEYLNIDHIYASGQATFVKHTWITWY